MSPRKRIVQADSADGQRAGEAIIQAVENQLRDNAPPEAAATLERLMQSGQSRENALRLIGACLAVEVYHTLKHHAPYNETRYLENLRRLPELPFDES